MDSNTIADCIADCDKRLASVEKLLEIYNDSVGLEELDEKIKNQFVIDELKIGNKLVKVEKLIYQSLLKTGNNDLFPKLNAKYDDLMVANYNLLTIMFKAGLNKESYIDSCKDSLEKSHCMEKICYYGEHR